jgi:hypothetical protein
MITVVWRGANELATALGRLPAKVQIASREATRFVATTLIRQAKLNATGPPRLARDGTQGMHPGSGPGVVTGRLRNSIVITSQGALPGFGYQVTVAPTVAYSRRLELGFTGTDSLGRHYNQPAYPYFGTAYEFVVQYVARPAFARAWASAMK